MDISSGFHNITLTSSHLSCECCVTTPVSGSVVLVRGIMSISSVSSGMVDNTNTTVERTTTPMEVKA